jgi:hypothetical protein
LAAAKKSAPKKPSEALVSVAAIQRQIYVIRDRQVMLDSDLAELYGVETGALTRAVRRNQDRFPDDFMFQLGEKEWRDLRSQIGISNEGSGGRRYAPYVFSEQGVAMLSSVLRSKQAVAVNVEIMRAFVELRRMAHSHGELARRVDELEAAVAGKLGEHDEKLAAIFQVLREVTFVKSRKRRAGFMPPAKE